MFFSQELSEKWYDESIPKPAKSEAIEKFNRRFGYKSVRRFYQLVGRTAMPTPDENVFLTALIEEYWGFYHPQQAA